ncbi:MAG: helicase-associated domain-containing protein [Planctomycetota bacterium]|nr:helicase-associated domain-containing protein [Planctomycetota bacterium]
MVSAKDKLASVLRKCMSDQDLVRKRFEGLGGSQKAFLVSLLRRDGYQGTLGEVRSGQHGGQIADYEVETILRSLLGGGFVHKERTGNGGGRQEVFTIPEELGNALRRTISIEERGPIEMLSLQRSGATGNGAAKPASRIRKLPDKALRKAALKALEDNHGILPHSAVAGGKNDEPNSEGNGKDDEGLFPKEWRKLLEESSLGTIGVLNLKDFGIKFEEEALILYQESLFEDFLGISTKLPRENEAEVFLGSDFVIDLERLLELVRSDKLEVTREGRLYKKIEDRISGSLISTRCQEVFEGKVVQHLLDTARRLRFFEVEDQRLVPIALRRREWQKKTLREKLQALFDLFLDDHKDGHWSFHQKSLRRIFLEQLKDFEPGTWLSLPSFLGATVARFLFTLEEAGIREEYQACCDDEHHSRNRGIADPIKVSMAKLYHDLSHWVVHRMALLGVVDVGLASGTIQSLRLSDLGQRFFGLKDWEESDSLGRPALINPDFEVLVFPEMPLEDEANLVLSRFADRLGSDRVKRYRLTRESVKRGICAGFTGAQLMEALREYGRNAMPPNVEFSVKEWSQGVEIFRREKVTLIRSESGEGLDRLTELLGHSEIAFERLNKKTMAVRGAKNEKAILGLAEELRQNGLYVE